MNDFEVVVKTENLAREFYKLMGCVVPDTFKFRNSLYPQQRLCWVMAVIAQDMLCGTDVESVCSYIDE